MTFEPGRADSIDFNLVERITSPFGSRLARRISTKAIERSGVTLYSEQRGTSLPDLIKRAESAIACSRTMEMYDLLNTIDYQLRALKKLSDSGLLAAERQLAVFEKNAEDIMATLSLTLNSATE